MEQASPAPDLRYPVGHFAAPPAITVEDRRRAIEEIAQMPSALRSAVNGLSAEQLDTPYREGGWTVRQGVHHFADSHMNSFVRFKLALTEDSPVIKPYDEAAWAELADSRGVPVETSLALVDGLHARWVALLRSMGDAQYRRTFAHPERGLMPLDVTLLLYAWHCRHHLAHINALKIRQGW